MKLKIIIACLLLYGVNFSGHGQLKGTVSLDRTNDKEKKHSKKGVENVVVSDGYHVVRTDRKGNFILPGWKKQRFVTIYPSGDLKPEKRFIPITPVTDSYDFIVAAKEKKEEVNFVQISDTETFQYGDWVDNLKKYIKVHR
ncbi:MAG TPA: metallophosphoesterase N-terminal domain-containing protein, partial [Arenibacter sp.]|nr:metallophosphoesterase N-terminal domain-containing protein [Arenibacter sp.]